MVRSRRFLDKERVSWDSVNCEAVLLVNRLKSRQVPAVYYNFHRNLDIWYKWALNGFSAGSETDCYILNLSVFINIKM